MMGSGGGVPPAMTTGAGLAELAALVEVTRDPEKYQAMIAELTTRASSLDTREAKLKARAEELDKRAGALDTRELDMLRRLEAAANQRAEEKVRYAQRQADERLAEVNAIMAHVNGVLARLTKVVKGTDDLKTAVEKFIRVVPREAA